MALSTDRNPPEELRRPSKRSLAAAALKLCAVSGRETAVGDLSYRLPKTGGLVDNVDNIDPIDSSP
jgi:hypothetical protein